MAPIALQLAGSEEQKHELLPRIASGEISIGIAVNEHVGARDNEPVQHRDGLLFGRAMFAFETQDCDKVLVATNMRELHIVEHLHIGVNRLFSVDKTRSIAELTFDGSPSQHLNSSSNNEDTLQSVLDAGRIGIAADTLGAAQTMLNKAVTYAGERQQFNRVIGSFQAVKHMCAEMAAELEPCRSLVWYAAHAFSAIPEDARLTACHAKAHLSDVGRTVARKATEVHGGMGFTDLLGLHYWFKRIELNHKLLGTPEFVRNEAAKVQGWV